MSKKIITLKYFASMREARGLSEETRTTSVDTVGHLYQELDGEFNFPLKQNALRVAINDEYVSWEASVQDQDVVVFIPPVNGG